MDIDHAKHKAQTCHMSSISLDNQPFVPLTCIKRTDAKLAKNIRVVLSNRRSTRINYFLARYERKIVVVYRD